MRLLSGACWLKGEGLAEARGLRMRGVAPLRKRHGYSIAVDPTQKMLTSETESKIRWWGSLCEC